MKNKFILGVATSIFVSGLCFNFMNVQGVVELPIVTFESTTSTTTIDSTNYLDGDVNKDGKVNALDLILLKKILLNII